ncbi:MAG: hypothetical protein AVO34_13665 [Firmicutes bacterium ML8_F2]|jgi:pimeloyl-ACP methyl ester carboxylesterase|nr:MAG: hypothetical protein AVO34_13665 [Firmicutes bacterium ML8_F2]
MSGKRKVNKTALVSLLILILLIAGFSGFYLYVQVKTYPAAEEQLALVYENPALLIMEESDLIKVTPDAVNSEQPAIIFYPGGLVAPQAYLYKMGKLAEALQTEVYIVKPPFNAAIFSVNAAARIIADSQLEKVWVGGHSLGGIAAARYTAKNMELVDVLFLFGSYSDRDLIEFQGQVLSIMGLNDQIINRDNYETAKANLPLQTVIIEKEGLNHSDFGNYGLQDGDSPGILPNEDVIEDILSAFEGEIH